MKDRKFLLGMLVGAMVGGAVAFVQPLQAADKTMEAIAKVLVKMYEEQKTTNKELAELKALSKSISESTKKSASTQSFQDK